MPYVRRTKRRPSVSRRLKTVAVVSFAIAAVLVLGGLFAMQQERVARGSAEAASFTPEPLPSSAPINTVAVIGDSYTDGTSEGGAGPTNWTALAEAALKTDEVDVSVRSEAAGGSGYVNRGLMDKTFGDMVPEVVHAGTDVVVFFGSRNDMTQDPQEVSDAASAAFDEAIALAPEATLLVVGAPWVNGEVPLEIDAVNAALASAATTAGVSFVDPASEQWFFDNPELIGSDGVHPTNAGHAYMATKIVPRISEHLN